MRTDRRPGEIFRRLIYGKMSSLFQHHKLCRCQVVMNDQNPFILLSMAITCRRNREAIINALRWAGREHPDTNTRMLIDKYWNEYQQWNTEGGDR